MSNSISVKEESENRAYNYALDIYHAFCDNGSVFDDYLWLLDTQTAGRALNQKGKMFNSFLPDNTLSVDALRTCVAITKPSDINIIKDHMSLQLETIEKTFPELKGAIENLFSKIHICCLRVME